MCINDSSYITLVFICNHVQRKSLLKIRSFGIIECPVVLIKNVRFLGYKTASVKMS